MSSAAASPCFRPINFSLKSYVNSLPYGSRIFWVATECGFRFSHIVIAHRLRLTYPSHFLNHRGTMTWSQTSVCRYVWEKFIERLQRGHTCIQPFRVQQKAVHVEEEHSDLRIPGTRTSGLTHFTRQSTTIDLQQQKKLLQTRTLLWFSNFYEIEIRDWPPEPTVSLIGGKQKSAKNQTIICLVFQ